MDPFFTVKVVRGNTKPIVDNELLLTNVCFELVGESYIPFLYTSDASFFLHVKVVIGDTVTIIVYSRYKKM